MKIKILGNMSYTRRNSVLPSSILALKLTNLKPIKKSTGLPKILSSFLPTKDIIAIRKSQKANSIYSAVLSLVIIAFSFSENYLDFLNDQKEATTRMNIIR